MSFSKAPLKRFNDFENDATSTPPIGAYDPQFSTDMGNSATIKSSKSRMVQARSFSRPALKRLPSMERCRTPLVPPSRLPITLKEPSTQDKLSHLEKKHEELEEMFKEKSKKYDELQDLLHKSEEDKTNWIKNTETCQVSITELTASLKDIQERLDKANLEVDSRKKALVKGEELWQVQTGKLQTSVKELEKQIEQHQSRNTELEKRLETVEKENQALESDRVKMQADLEDEQLALSESERKCVLLQVSMEEAHAVFEGKLCEAEEKNATLQDTESKLLDSLKLSKGQIDDLRVAVQAEKSGRVHSEERLTMTENTLFTLRSEWEGMEKEYKEDISRLEKCLKVYVDNPTKVLNQKTHEMATQFLKERENTAELKRRMEPLVKVESLLKQGLTKFDSSQHLSSSSYEGLDGIALPEMVTFSDDESLLDISSPIPKNITIYDTTLPSDLKQKVQELKHCHTETSLKAVMHEEQRAETRNLISKIEKDNQMKRKHIISINSQINELSNTDTKVEPSSSLSTMDAILRSPQSDPSLKVKWVSSSAISPRSSSGKLFGAAKLDPIAEEEEDKTK
ncbi:hypothetical protein Fcan01_07990 [Folsomia candida]|uniref:Uncharacterized protein n=2 Tax=Folsomia candida TaxID=158441 RepID=A0A226ENC6_FOLCA|nr:hypothetical protein Fcan01_07990 [Folsomia candida]